MISALLLLFITSCYAHPATVANHTLSGATVCSSASALAKNLIVTLSTDTPTKGENISTIFDFDLDAPITGGTAYYSATLNGFPYTSQAPLCDETVKSSDPCPLLVGHHHQVSTSENTVSGKLVVKITWNDPSGAEILCTQITTKTV